MARPLWLLLCVLSASVLAEENASSGARIVDSTHGRMPEHTVAPGYPDVARRDRIEGTVQVCFEVTRKGRPRRVAVRHSTNRVFEKASVRAVKASRFRPVPDGEAVPQIKSCRTFIFELEPADDTGD